MPGHYNNRNQSGPSIRRRRHRRRRKVRPPIEGRMGGSNIDNPGGGQQYSSELPNSNGTNVNSTRMNPRHRRTRHSHGHMHPPRPGSNRPIRHNHRHSHPHGQHIGHFTPPVNQCPEFGTPLGNGVSMGVSCAGEQGWLNCDGQPVPPGYMGCDHDPDPLGGMEGCSCHGTWDQALFQYVDGCCVAE